MLPSYERMEANKGMTVEFINTLLSWGLFQINSLKNIAGNVLDLVFTNNPDLLEISCNKYPLITVDRFHPPLQIILHHNEAQIMIGNDNEKHELVLCYKKTDFEMMKGFFDSYNFNQVFAYESVEEITNAFHEILNEGIEKYTPKIKMKCTNRPRYFNKELQKLKNLKNKAHKEWSKTGNKRRYNAIRSIFDPLNYEMQQSYLAEVANSVKRDSSNFWKFIKENRSTNVTPNKLMMEDEVAENPQEIVDLFAKHFEKTYSVDQIDFDINEFLETIEDSEETPKISVTVVKEAIKNIKNHAGRGEDSIHPIILRNCLDELAFPITHLFNKILSTEIFPKRWKKQYIVPVHKNGSRYDASKYRPIAIPPTLAKLFDSILSSIITPLIEDKIDENQHGFTKGRSTITNLMQTTSVAVLYHKEYSLKN